MRMPKVHFVARAAKKNPVADVGESYWWWSSRYKRKIYSKEKPTREQIAKENSEQLKDLLTFLEGDGV